MVTFRSQHVEVKLVRDDNVPYEESTIHSSEDVFELLKSLADEAVERFTVIFMSSRHRVMAVEIMFSGSITESVMSVRHIIKVALDVHAVAIIVAHNHPSGDPAPSSEDRQLTKNIDKACKLFDIQLLDHIIIGADRYYSFMDDGGWSCLSTADW